MIALPLSMSFLRLVLMCFETSVLLNVKTPKLYRSFPTWLLVSLYVYTMIIEAILVILHLSFFHLI
jgi:hypothetical protein